MTNYLEVTNLSKSFDSFQLHNISFTLPKGYIMGLIGPNGSGKTTTIKLILNMLGRTGGTVKVMGLDNITEEQKVKSELGVVFDTNYFSDDWKVLQVEKSISVFYPNWNRQKFADMLRKFHIAPTKKVKELSKGMQMKLVGFLVTLLLLSKMPAIGNSIILVIESSPILLVFLAVFAIVVMYAVSIILSIRIMKKKEM
ncbi:ATP-binding cassette domain-containing protein [Bacteroides acidifaciens]|uniref:ATP-binding cassette domain-containing protein n=1 Tax=Bacteroides acidifaciens TaxID=85831 RepID=UPI0025A530EC|nr:ATP-binding cassette domain-containing protein [Bacteroides acidifaciens]